MAKLEQRERFRPNAGVGSAPASAPGLPSGSWAEAELYLLTLGEVCICLPVAENTFPRFHIQDVI